MTRQSRNGFTIIEMLVAITILAVGVLAVASSTIFTTRNLHRSRLATVASVQATSKLDELIGYAAATSPPCTSTRFASSSAPVTASGVTLTWTVPGSGPLRTVQVFARYRLSAVGERVDTIIARIAC
jgi:prepilin-type N-terminal cleavage/methylation domain-containing protein